MPIDINQLNAEADQMLASAIKVLNTPVQTPGYSGANFSKSNAELARTSKTRDETSKVIDESRVLAQQATQGIKTGEDAKAAAIGDKARADQQQAQMVADNYKYYAQLFGVDSDPSAYIAQVAKRLTQERPVAETKLRKIQEMQSVSFLDSPLDFLYNAFQLPSAVNDYNREADIINAMQTSVDSSLKTGIDAANFSAKGIPTITVGQAKAVADGAAAEAAINKAKADEALARTNVDFATKKLAGDMSMAQATLHSTSLQIQDAHNRFQAQLASIQAADTRANRLMKGAELLGKVADNQALDVLLQYYDKIIGKPPGTTTRQIFKSFSDEQQKDIAAIAAGSGGANAYDAFVNIAKVIPGNAMSPETRSTMEWMQQKISAHSADLDNKQVDAKLRPVRMAEAVNAEIKREQEQAYKPGTLFHEVEPAKLIAAGFIPKDSKLAQILEPLTKTTTPMLPEVVVKTIMAQYSNPVEAGHIIAQYYDANVTFMNTAGNFQLLKIPPMKGYKVPGAKGMFGLKFGESMPSYDLTRPEEATKYVLRTLTQDAAKRILSPGPTGTNFPGGQDFMTSQKYTNATE